MREAAFRLAQDNPVRRDDRAGRNVVFRVDAADWASLEEMIGTVDRTTWSCDGRLRSACTLTIGTV
jgi:hypothetical protein